MLIVVIIIVAVAFALYMYAHSKSQADNSQPSQPTHFDLLDENGDPIKEPEVKIVIGGGDSDAKVQELEHFCIKDKGYHVSVWPKNYSQFDFVEFSIAGISHRDNIENYIGEFVGLLQAEPTNAYDSNAIKVVAHDGHHVGYVPADMTAEIRKEATLPCPCFCYIGCNDGTYFSDCYVLRKKN
jgi:hypothetical protein